MLRLAQALSLSDEHVRHREDAVDDGAHDVEANLDFGRVASGFAAPTFLSDAAGNELHVRVVLPLVRVVDDDAEVDRHIASAQLGDQLRVILQRKREVPLSVVLTSGPKQLLSTRAPTGSRFERLRPVDCRNTGEQRIADLDLSRAVVVFSSVD